MHELGTINCKWNGLSGLIAVWGDEDNNGELQLTFVAWDTDKQPSQNTFSPNDFVEKIVNGEITI